MWRDIYTSPSKIFLGCLISFLCGVAISSVGTINAFVIFCGVLSVVYGTWLTWRYARVRAWLLWATFLLCGLWRFQMVLPDFSDATKIYHYTNQKVSFVGAVQRVDRTLKNQHITLGVKNIENKNPVRGRVMIYAPLYPEYAYGDKLKIICTLRRPEKMADFDFEKYMARFSIYATCSFADIERMPSEISLRSFFFSSMSIAKKNITESLVRSIGGFQSSVMVAMIVGDRGGMSPELVQNFSTAGISHIVAISGMNITIIIVVLMYVIIGMGVIRQRAFWIIVVAILFFMILVGDQSSAWRAAVMGIIFLYAQKIGRPRGVPNAILMAAVIMVAINPRVLLYDVGFQLSFAAFAGLLYVAPVLEKYFFHMPAWGNMKEIFITTLSAQIATLPLLLFYFHSFSLIALVTNSLILPIVPFLTVWGIANAGVGLFSFVLGRVMGFVSWLGISYILYITHIMTKIPYASVAWPLGGAGLLFMYAIIIWVVSINREKINNEE